MHLDLNCLESFVVLAEEKHFGRAAARLHLTSAALTKRLQRLERDLKVRLVERDSAGVLALTPEGQRLAADAGPLLAHERVTRTRVTGH